MENKVGLSVAHYPKKAGARFRGFSEHYESMVWVLLVQRALESLGVEVVIAPIGELKGKVAWLNKQHVDVALEIHFNGSVNPEVNGSETLYYPGSKRGKRFASIVHSSYEIFMCNKDRGVKEGWYRMDRPFVADYPGDKEGDEMPDYFLKKTNCPALILEPDFISQIQNISEKRFTACVKIAEGIIQFLESEDG